MTRKTENQLSALTVRNPQPQSPYAGVQNAKREATGMAWEQRQSGELKLLISAVTANGHALMFAQTRNGGLSLTVYSEGDPIKFRLYDDLEIDTVIGNITETALKALPPEIADRVCKLSAE